MKLFFVMSSMPGEGKSTVIAGLASNFRKQGKEIGYLKPVCLRKQGENADSDSKFFQGFLALKETLEVICPLQITQEEMKNLSGKDELPESIFEAFTEASSGKDIMFVEGLSGISPDKSEARINSRLVNKLGAEVIAVTNLSGKKVEDFLSQAEATYAKHFSGLIINNISPGQIEAFRETVSSVLKDKSSRILGLLPRDRALSAITLGDLIKGLQAKPLNEFDRMDDLVENIMAGSHGVDPGLYYYSQRDKKVVVLRSDRPDMQIAALRTPTLAMFLSGKGHMYNEALFQAKANNIPVFSVSGSTEEVIEKISQVIKPVPFYGMKKVERIGKLLADNVNLNIAA